jgi:hypothetical protein
LTGTRHQESAKARGSARPGLWRYREQETSLGWEALALVEERIRRENLHRLELLRLKAYAPL